MSISVEILLKLIDQFSAPARAATDAIKKIGEAGKGVNGGGGVPKLTDEVNKLGASAARASQQFGLLRQGVGNVGKGLALGVTTGVAFWATKAAAALSFTRRELLGTMEEFDRYQAILTTVQGSPDKARQSAEWALDFAYWTPYSVGEVVDGMTRLAAYGVVNLDNLKDTEVVMKGIGDAASAMGKSFPDAVEAVFKATMGEYESLKSLGVIMRKNGKQISMEYADASGKIIKKMVKDDRRVIRDALVDIFKQRFDGGMKRQAQTVGSMIVGLQDAWTKLKLKIADSGVGDELRKQLEGAMGWLDEFFEKPVTGSLGGGGRGYKTPKRETYGDSKADIVARKISEGLAVAIREIVDIGQKAAAAIQWLYEATDAFVKTDFGQAIGGWRGLATAIGLLKFTPAIWFIGKGLAQIAAATVLLSAGSVVDLASAIKLFAAGEIMAGIKAVGLLGVKFAGIAASVAAAYIAIESLIALMNGGLTDGQINRFGFLADAVGLDSLKAFLEDIRKTPQDQRAAKFGEALGEAGKKAEAGLNQIPGLAALTDAIFGEKAKPTIPAPPMIAAPAAPTVTPGSGKFTASGVPAIPPPPQEPPRPTTSGIKVSPAAPYWWWDKMLPEIKTPEPPVIPVPKLEKGANGVFDEIKEGIRQGGAAAASEASAVGGRVDAAFDAVNGMLMGQELMQAFAAGIRSGGASAVGEARSVAGQVRGALSGAGAVGGGGAGPAAPSAVPNRTPGPQSRGPTNNNIAVNVPRADDVKLARAIAREVRGNLGMLGDGYGAGAVG